MFKKRSSSAPVAAPSYEQANSSWLALTSMSKVPHSSKGIITLDCGASANLTGSFSVLNDKATSILLVVLPYLTSLLQIPSKATLSPPPLSPTTSSLHSRLFLIRYIARPLYLLGSSAELCLEQLLCRLASLPFAFILECGTELLDRGVLNCFWMISVTM